ncbi:MULTISPECIES: lysophospholipid acyltransferase family protein [Bacillaceae]|uniref:lysophospholipid acyltransferase family protein n=1 Tax=Bacillaceae TaxID=186817 RepID=UPI001BDDEF2E|nr:MULTISPECIES: lysophospholipid acyltransferase family protein [Bacillaceae]MDX8359862.1 lysophospholipid acyltransferase family protein [Cytobacillus sp. IB215316]
MAFYTIAKNIVWGILKPLFRIKIIGSENIPKEGSVLICSNHISVLDPPVVGITSTRPIHFMAKEELFRVPILKTAISNLNAFPVKRGMGDRSAIRNGLAILNDNKALGIFPEGTRNKEGNLGKGLAGVGFFALRSNALVVPCAIIGPYKPFRKLYVVYGRPVDITEMRKQKASASEVTDVIMNAIGEILENYDVKAS